MKIIINRCYGGFSFSEAAMRRFAELKGLEFHLDDIFPCAGDLNSYDIPRDDPDAIAVVEELGEAADGDCASLKIIEIPDGISWEIAEYDGMEWVAEVHRTWR